ncbi:hypothetical protein, variant [Aphanomyces invadans]|uniref:PTM/DIR17-like Tudor domain-containing protein n=1 Tax=Aphanomyces invadans TaxID=157072 RepID=A0A024TYM7_9STRA|nr:hypothetical protein H310_08578 [Aphanomyces invadans]XP_008872609.1 hypothetical protein, variant [Aphanomyces invadans]ETV98411.1 hypothetical protein H310_08578 [Aphanomyces invadans]ETV98412.1 hypothetical protein, variant [Aphanomyces invadans]|eukprot:XP_008872608.1 hypothetical protein H310_08578 [Aphanomyces invadans]
MEDKNDVPSTTLAAIIDNPRRDLSPAASGIPKHGTDDCGPYSSSTSTSGHGRQRRQSVQDNGSETESDTDSKSYSDQSRGLRDGNDRRVHNNLGGRGDQPHYGEPVAAANDDINKRGGQGSSSVLSNLLVRPGLDNPIKQSDHPQQPPPTLPQLGHQTSGDVRLPAISLHPPATLGSFSNNNSRTGPPPLLDQPGHLSDMHRVSSTNGAGVNGSPGLLNRPRPDLGSNRSSWIAPSSRPNTIDGLDRPASPRSSSYGSANNPNAAHVSAGRDDFDYPTYQPPESLVGQRIAKTFAGHGRFVGQVVKYNSQTELFTVVYADGDTEELTRENTMNLLIEDKRIHHGKPREPMRKPAEPPQQHVASVMKNGPPFKPTLTERDIETLNALFERHAWPALADNGWRSDVQGATLYVYPPWAGKNTREPEYFSSVVDTIVYLTSHADLLRLCFPVDVQSTLFAILDGLRHNAKRGAPEAGPPPSAGVLKRIKAESPSSHPSAIRSLPASSSSRPPYFEHHPHPPHPHHPQHQPSYPDPYPPESMRRQHAEPPNSHSSRYPRLHGDEDPRRTGYAPPPSAIQAPVPSTDHRFPPPARHIRDDVFVHQRMGPNHPRGHDYDQCHHPSAVGGFVNPPPLTSHSPHHSHADLTTAPRPVVPQHHFSHPDNRLVPSQAPPQMNHPSPFNEPRSENSATTAPRFNQPPPRPLGQPVRSNVISMSDLDKSSSLTRPGGDQQPRLRMYPTDQQQSLPPQPPAAPYARIRTHDWNDDQRYNSGDQSSYRRDHHDRMYAADRFGPGNPSSEGYYDDASLQQRFPGRTDAFPRPDPLISNPNGDHTPQDYQYSRRLP